MRLGKPSLRLILTRCLIALSVVGLLSAVVPSLRPVTAGAYNLLLCQWPRSRVAPTRITFGNFSAGYSGGTQDAAGRWNSRQGRFKLVSNSTSYLFQVHASDFGSTGYDGFFQGSCINGYFQPHSALTEYNTFYTDGYPYPGQVQVMVHEIGHAVGLAHNDPAPCLIPIMYYSSDRYFQCGLQNPTVDDVTGTNSMY